jgi:hypothetical protein
MHPPMVSANLTLQRSLAVLNPWNWKETSMTSADHVCDECIVAHMIASFSLSIVQCQDSVLQELTILTLLIVADLML